jgi:hypothetical protein
MSRVLTSRTCPSEARPHIGTSPYLCRAEAAATSALTAQATRAECHHEVMSVPDLPPPSDPDGTPRDLVTELGIRVGEAIAARWCAELLAGGDPHDFVGMLPYLGRNTAVAAFDPAWHAYWPRTWGARGLLYVWDDSVAGQVVAGLADEHWRPAEMCLKVATGHQIGEAGPAAILLVDHDLPRVRVNAVRCLGVVGDTEHVAAVRMALADDDSAVRRTAARSLTLMSARLDLAQTDVGDPTRGRVP